MPLRACAHPTCTSYVRSGRFCGAHAEQGRAARAETTRFYDQHVRDADAKRFYNSAAWLSIRAAVLAAFPVCQRCIEAWAEHVHHVKPLRDCSPAEAIDRENLRAVCPSCHNAIEAEAAAAAKAVV